MMRTDTGPAIVFPLLGALAVVLIMSLAMCGDPPSNRGGQLDLRRARDSDAGVTCWSWNYFRPDSISCLRDP